MIATNGFLNSLPVKHFAIQNPKSKIQNGITHILHPCGRGQSKIQNLKLTDRIITEHGV
jgi:hypothetical protein